jgi:hypothetical protein
LVKGIALAMSFQHFGAGLGADFYQRNADLTRLEEHRLACVCAWITTIGVRVRQA